LALTNISNSVSQAQCARIAQQDNDVINSISSLCGKWLTVRFAEGLVFITTITTVVVSITQKGLANTATRRSGTFSEAETALYNAQMYDE